MAAGDLDLAKFDIQKALEDDPHNRWLLMISYFIFSARYF